MTTENLDKTIEDNKENYAKDAFKIIMKNWGIHFAKLPQVEKMNVLKDILKLAGINLADSPAGGLAIKLEAQKVRDNDTQIRIRFSQSWNLAVEKFSYDKSKSEEEWQVYYYKKLGEQIND